VSQWAESRTPDGSPPGPEAPAERLGIAGSGTVACGLAACVAAQGAPVLVWARSAQSVERARRKIAQLHERLERDEAAAAVRITSDLSDLSEATLVVEAVAEDVSLKRKLFATLSASLPPGSMIATTTSSLRVSELAQACGRPSRFFGLHVFNPVHQMELVELCFPARGPPPSARRSGSEP
jgi:3-hydroxybutyryl-CoA dehydrogenase